MTLNSQDLVNSIKQTFLNQDKYLFDKYVPEFKVSGKFLGDVFNQIAVEPKGKQPPRFYHNLSPFDVISRKAPDRALVFENGELLLDTDFTDHVVSRTAAMDAVVLSCLGVKSLKDKKILLFGSGNIAQRTTMILKAEYPDLQEVDCISGTKGISAITTAGKKYGVTVKPGSLAALSEYDVILCHTNASKPVLDAKMLKSIKPGAIITTFISSTEHGEVADEFYNSEANVICDWDRTIDGAKDLSRAVESRSVRRDRILYLKDLLSEPKAVDSAKKYTIYRSVGTPVQNLAVLKLLVK